jgi:hypothetical protein
MRFIELDQEILDTKTNLIWSKHFKKRLCFDEAIEYAEQTATVTGLFWRLPSIDELCSLIDRSIINPASNFPGIPHAQYLREKTISCIWSSSPYLGNTDYMWFINLDFGSVYYSGSKHNTFTVMLVRDDTK